MTQAEKGRLIMSLMIEDMVACHCELAYIKITDMLEVNFIYHDLMFAEIHSCHTFIYNQLIYTS